MISIHKFLFIIFFFSLNINSQELPRGFVILKEVIPDLIVDLRYRAHDNFMGKPVEGYNSNEAVGTIELANALKKAQKVFNSYGFGIKIYDSYRPQRSVNDFIRWSQVQSDTISKASFYPKLNKNSLFDLGFIAEKSGHSRGSTVDITLTHIKGGKKGDEIDMGGPWDFFGNLSHYSFSEISEKQKQNRKLLREILINSGFDPYNKEWWHFTLKNEPFPDTYFNFLY